MKRKSFIIFTTMALLFSTQSVYSSKDKTEKKKVVDVLQYSTHIEDGLKKMAIKYEVETGVKVNIHTISPIENYRATIKQELESKTPPDIFMIQGREDIEIWKGKVVNLTMETWADEVVLSAFDEVSIKDQYYGMPLSMEGYGLIYNNAIFQKAGINPKTITTLDQLIKACNDLESKKKELGIKNPISYTTKEDWVTGDLTFNIGMAYQSNPQEFTKNYMDNKENIVFNKMFCQWMNLVDVLVKFSDTKNLDSIDYEEQVRAFAKGETAMIFQGDWIHSKLREYKAPFDICYIPLSIGNKPEESNRLPIRVPNYLAVNKKSKVKKEALDFLTWYTSSVYAQRTFAHNLDLMPPFIYHGVCCKNPLLNELIKKGEKGYILGWYIDYLPYGFGRNEIAPIFSDYAKGKIDKEGMMDRINNAVR